MFHRRALRDVLANQAVGVLVRATFPGVVGVGKVEGGAGGLLDVAVAVELGAIVDGDGLEQVRMRADQLDAGNADRRG
jgi:hypothetical protein